jgi:hypothetical protein
MSIENDTRVSVVQALLRQGKQIQKYEEMIAETAPGTTIAGLAPWWFQPTPERDVEFCSKAAGRPVLPFAQAVDEDMMACFKTDPSGSPGVLVINPWSEGWGPVVLADLPDFDAWLVYAKQISDEFHARAQAEGEAE